MTAQTPLTMTEAVELIRGAIPADDAAAEPAPTEPAEAAEAEQPEVNGARFGRCGRCAGRY